MTENSQSQASIEAAAKVFEENTDSSQVLNGYSSIIPLICNDLPVAEQAARLVASGLKREVGDKKAIKALVDTAIAGKNSASAQILLKGLQGMLGDASIEADFAARLKPERPEVYDGVILDRLLTAIEWQRSKKLTTKIKALIRRLEDGQLSRGSLSNLQTMQDFVKSQRKVTKVQKQQLEDLITRMTMTPERFQALLKPYGIREIEELKNGEARGLIQRLAALASRHNADGITSRQINYVRRLIKKLGLDDDAESIIAEEVAQKKNIAELSKEQGSMVIEWLIEQGGGE
ncbi:MAG: hypothetical protein P1V97_08025 [Planctomycetota bacterium]|nr:hypothetical protein [Planctomycetota bacterium]